MKLRGTRVQYGFILHRNCFLLMNMFENFIKLQIFQNYKIKKKKIKDQFFFLISKFQKFLKFFFFFQKFKMFIIFQKFPKMHKI